MYHVICGIVKKNFQVVQQPKIADISADVCEA